MDNNRVSIWGNKKLPIKYFNEDIDNLILSKI